MSIKEGILTLKNSTYNNTEGALNPETVNNTQDNERNINQDINTGASPVINSRNQMITNNQIIPVQIQAQQNQILTYNNQTLPGPLIIIDPLLTRPGIPSYNEIQQIQLRTGQVPNWLVKVYNPFETTCPVCKNNVKTVTEKFWNWSAFFSITFGGILCLGLPNLIRTCGGSECCCYDAIHKCPNCGTILAKRNTMVQ